jgi:hypothetical protein
VAESVGARAHLLISSFRRTHAQALGPLAVDFMLNAGRLGRRSFAATVRSRPSLSCSCAHESRGAQVAQEHGRGQRMEGAVGSGDGGGRAGGAMRVRDAFREKGPISVRAQ